MLTRSAKNKYKKTTDARYYLEQRTYKDPISGCWLWTGPYDKNGYGQIQSSTIGRTTKIPRAHQLAYVSYIGDNDQHLLVCHKCDTPECVNPAHLFLGTVKDNNADKTAKGRNLRKATIVLGNTGKLTMPDVHYIKSQRHKKTCYELAAELGVSFSRVSQIWRDKYAH